MLSWVTRAVAGGAGEVTAGDLRAELDRGADLLLLDVRQPDEHAEGKIPGSVLIPLGELAGRAGELNTGRSIVVYCHSGMRSAMACRALRRAGFERVRNLAGGICAWRAASGA